MVGLDRFELSTSPLSGVRSSHLSYRPGAIHLKKNEFEDRVERADRLRRSGPSCETHEKRESKRGSLPNLPVKKIRMGYMATFPAKGAGCHDVLS